ncbi:MAG: thioredoxin [Clostridiales bacterium]|nr:thioredoxin [Clostridiales bacterium]
MLQFTSESMKPENMAGLVLVDFWAPWCGPCRIAAPILEQLSEEYEGKVAFAKLNIDDYPEVAAGLGVMSIPTLILFKDGKEIDRIIGMMGKPAFKAMVEKHLV